MTILASGLITLLNGLLALVGHVLSPVTLALLVMTVAFGWLARLEVDDLNRQTTKPVVGRH